MSSEVVIVIASHLLTDVTFLLLGNRRHYSMGVLTLLFILHVIMLLRTHGGPSILIMARVFRCEELVDDLLVIFLTFSSCFEELFNSLEVIVVFYLFILRLMTLGLTAATYSIRLRMYCMLSLIYPSTGSTFVDTLEDFHVAACVHLVRDRSTC